jgi:ribosome maturation protein Sdo1
LDVIRQLKQSNNIPIQQAQMRVQLTVPGKEKKTTRIFPPKNDVFFF